MTAIVRHVTRTTAAASDVAGAARPFARVGERGRTLVAFAGVSGLAAVLYLWDLTVSGYANEYYAMAAQAASQSWSAWFFGSLDAGGFITVDKPPLATMLMGLSVRLFGLSPASILLPQALLGVATVALLFAIVRRRFGIIAATIAGIVMALTPVGVLIFRYDNPDALLTFLLVAAAGALLASVESGRRRWLVATGLLVGAGFLTKYLQAYLVLPAFALTYVVAASGSLRRRILDLAVLAVVTLLASGWWVAAVQLVPASSRPYIGGSSGNSVLDLIFGYDGLGRILGAFGVDGGPPGGGGGGGFGGMPGLLRMFNAQFAGGISWLLPFALIALVTGLATRLRLGRRDDRLAAYLLWGGWLVVQVVVFSLMSGVIHSYYTVVLAPAIAVLVGSGTVAMWHLRARHPLGGLPLASAILATAGWAFLLLGRTPDFAPGLGIAVLALGVAAAIVVAAPSRWIGRRAGLVAATVGLLALLAAPAAYAAATVTSAHSGGDPSAGPATGRLDAFGGAGPGGGGPGGGLVGAPPAFAGSASPATPPGGAASSGASAGPVGGIGVGGFGGGGPDGGGRGGALDQTTIDYLVANRYGATWLVAVSSSNEAAPIQLATGVPVMAMGGFNGSDAALTVDRLKSLVATGRLRYVVMNGQGGPGGGSTSGVDSWVASTCKVATDTSGNALAGGSLYDCSAVATIGS